MYYTKRRWPIIVLICGIIAGAGVYAMYRSVKNFPIQQLLSNPAVQNRLVSYTGEKSRNLVSLIPEFLGFDESKTYLLLFQNDTELRPSGGFIGSYATVRVSGTHVELLALEGTESLDGRAPATFNVQPPSILNSELGVKKWFFRDSNWSPDFSVSAQQALDFYRAEGGVAAEEIDAVIGVDTTVLEELIGLSGSVTVEGLTFEKENVTEKLEREVEYDFNKRGVPFENRKDILKPFFHELLSHIKGDFLNNPKKYTDEMTRLIEQKHILAYSPHAATQAILAAANLTGTVTPGDERIDYLMWVDANMAALKTDHAIERVLSYEVKEKNGKEYSVARMTYTHTGIFDWRTSRYRTYARVFVPPNAELEEVNRVDADGKRTPISLSTVDAGIGENGHAWFGVLFVIEPKNIASLEYVYRTERGPYTIKDNSYALRVQKQPGVTHARLTLDLGFDTTITGANPAEVPEEWGDTAYRISLPLEQDMVYRIEKD